MLITSRPSWAISETEATPEEFYFNRRDWLRAAGFTGLGLVGASSCIGGFASTVVAAIGGYPAPRNNAYALDRDLTPEKEATTYTNFYEFGSSKNIWRDAQKLITNPWLVTIDGLVETEMKLDADDLIAKIGGLEERLYRHRCVEAWAMAVPWTGIPLANLIKLARPKFEAKFLRMETFFDPKIARGQKQSWYPWPYVEGLTIEEATNELAFLATGIYGKPMPAQNGAPIRLVIPWKYGFKSVKSIRRFTFTDQRPVSFWEQLNRREYGFWANVNPKVPHPRWSQETERLLGSNKNVATQIFNGYSSQVAGLYDGMFVGDTRVLFR
ncbi:MAG: protein-methionine-sulfoxide reductase catalytic subunit MsrP [Candidatus Puniceispirillaceae bacterium]